VPKPVFTIATPRELPVTRQGEHWWFEEGDRRVRLSNLDKVFWPEQGYTKGDLLAYYYNVAELILPHLDGHPLTMKRMPDGITGHEFYEKNAPSHTPDWVPRCRVESPDSEGGRIDFLMVDDVASLLYVTNLGCIEYHPLHSRCSHIDRPRYLFFDLDPNPPIEFSDVLAVAHHVCAALDALGLPPYAKTSGRNGMQIYVPIELGPSHENVRNFVGMVGRAVRDADPQRATMDHNKPKRAGKVYIDHNMNRFGANIAGVYSLRPRPEATASTPLTRDEITAGEVKPEHFTMTSVHERFARTGDLFAGMLTAPVDVRPSLETFGIRVKEDPSPKGDDVRAKLAEYDSKRDFSVTPEPAGGSSDTHGNRFVIQKHAADRAGLHYDLRLERDGTLVSWAVRRGLPTVPGEKHFAAKTEDHPLEYLDFEARIPKGEYGGGEMRIFDRGTYEAPEWEPGKMTIRLHGERVRGEYHLVQTRQGWLVFRSKRSGEVLTPPPMKPMMAEGGHDPFDDPGWLFEPKLDGVRTLAYVTTDATTLVSRSGRDQTAQYPELSNLAKYVNAVHAVLDGEIVAMNERGQPSFERLQSRINLTAERDIERAREACPVSIYLFDVLWLDERDLTSEPLSERRRVLREIVTEEGPVALTLGVEGDGRSFFEAAKGLGIEGIVAKRLDSQYEPGRRSRYWRKVKAMRTLDAVVLGWTPGGGSRADSFGALLLGSHRGGRLRWIGQVGTGFSGRLLADLQMQLSGIEIGEPAIDDPELRSVRGAHWVQPELVVEVTYLEVTKAGRLRAPSYLGLRPDKTPEDCLLEDAG
jgi:DNA ligase D-like protein (predicted ligase)/DNA ligase D-like protein (predicted polymerase)/DNA ligase D-like protein (predicted 3'-phosphoesterase)